MRRVQASSPFWHPATDNLDGTDSYGVYTTDYLSDSTFSRTWSTTECDQFLFATGDWTLWLIATNDAVRGEHYADEDREILMSSEQSNPYTAKWYNRVNYGGDPIIQLSQQGYMTDKIVYYEAKSPGHSAYVT